MEVVIVPGPGDAADVVAGVVVAALDRPHPVIGLATGSSPLRTYRRLIDAHRAGRVSFAQAHAVLLDEYVGLAPEHAQSYRSFIRANLTDHVDLPSGRLHGPDVWRSDLSSTGSDYEALLAWLGGVDVQLLGIGRDGHIGFNEPGSALGSRTRLKTLTAATRADNARFFDDPDEVPRHVITQGLATIGDARHLVLVAAGAAKATPIAAAVEGPLTASCPASVLQLHPHVTVVVDESAAAGLAHADYYREAYAGKPVWQGL
ncbi:MAG: glucosamine-6-phosphate deaminase [Desertimonas sp.]